MEGNQVRNLVRCIRSDMYGFTKDEVYQVVSMFYNIVDDNEEIYMCEESCFKESFEVI